jgi:hypothetical protein
MAIQAHLCMHTTLPSLAALPAALAQLYTAKGPSLWRLRALKTILQVNERAYIVKHMHMLPVLVYHQPDCPPCRSVLTATSAYSPLLSYCCS